MNTSNIKNIEAIVAVDEHFGLAKDGAIPWKNKEDMKFFKDKTLDNIVVMGSKTLLSLPNRAPLANRFNIVLTNNKETFVPGYLNYGNIVFYTHSEFIDYINNIQTNKIFFVIGGKQIYDLLLPLCNKIWLSIIPGNYNCDLKLTNLSDNSFDKFLEYYHIVETKIIPKTFTLYCLELQKQNK
jgi:dihydrofolate reductase